MTPGSVSGTPIAVARCNGGADLTFIRTQHELHQRRHSNGAVGGIQKELETLRYFADDTAGYRLGVPLIGGMTMLNRTMHCSFCGRRNSEVAKLVAWERPRSPSCRHAFVAGVNLTHALPTVVRGRRCRGALRAVE